ncbi:hypothetical protein ACLBYG_25320 [Methylobacterium sp. D53M]
MLYLNRVIIFTEKLDLSFRLRQYKLLSTTAMPVVDGIPLLSLTAIHDEAGFLLRFVQKSTDWMLKGVTSSILRITIMILVIPLAITGWLGLGLFSYGDLNDFTDTYALVLAITLIFAPIAYCLAILPSVYFPSLVKNKIYGEEKYLDHLLISSSAHERPVGWQPYIHGTPGIARWENIKTLIHSRIYDDISVFLSINEWIGGAMVGDYKKDVRVLKLPVIEGAPSDTNKILENIDLLVRMQSK